MAETLPSQCRGLGVIPGQEARSHLPQLRPGAAKKKKKKDSHPSRCEVLVYYGFDLHFPKG